MERSSKMGTASYRGRQCHASCVHTYIHYFFSCVWLHFCLKVFCFIGINSTLPLFEKDVLIKNGYFSATRSISIVMK